MRFSTILSIALCLAASTFAYPVEVRKNHGGGGKGGGGSGKGGGGSGKGGGGSGKGGGGGSGKDVKADVQATINKWLDDIKAVNKFVDTVGTVTDATTINSMATTALTAAQNEGDSLTELEKDVNLSSNAAAKALPAQFNIIGPAIKGIASDPSTLKTNLAKINGARCKGGAIKQEGDVQKAAAEGAGLKDPPAPEMPTACK